MSLTILEAAATAAALPFPGLVGALREMLARKRAGLTVAPERLAVPLEGGTLLVMPASDGEYASTKIVTVHAGNPERGLPSLLGEVLLMRADTGERLALFDGPTLTGRRTAALSALAALTLAPDRAASTALIVGSGVQGRAHLEAFAAVFGVRRFYCAARSMASARRLAEFGHTLGVFAEAIADPSEVLDTVRIIVTATTSCVPVIADRVRDDAFVAAVGAFRPEMCELPASLVRRAALFVDDLAGARHEAGDLIQAGVDWSQLGTLEARVAAEPAALDPDARRRPVVFKSVGQALWDLAAARFAWDCRRA